MKKDKKVGIVVFVILIIVIDFVVGKGLKQIYFSNNSGIEYRTTYIIDSVKSECVILGSSRAAHHYIPSVIADSINMSCYNAGIRARILYIQYEFLKCILNRYTPKLIVLDSSPFEITHTGRLTPDFTYLYPYYSENSEIQKSIDKENRMNQLCFLSHIYPYNSTLHLMFDQFNKQQEKCFDGYVPVEGVNKSKKRANIELSGVVDQNKVNVLQQFITLCRQKKVKLIVIQSPWFKEIKKDACYYKFEEILKRNQVEYYDMTRIAAFDNYYYFKDYGHLNDDGAKVYSRIVASKLKQLLSL